MSLTDYVDSRAFLLD